MNDRTLQISTAGTRKAVTWLTAVRQLEERRKKRAERDILNILGF